MSSVPEIPMYFSTPSTTADTINPSAATLPLTNTKTRSSTANNNNNNNNLNNNSSNSSNNSVLGSGNKSSGKPKGGKPGRKNWTGSQVDLLLDLLATALPVYVDDWQSVANQLNNNLNQPNFRDGASARTKFRKLLKQGQLQAGEGKKKGKKESRAEAINKMIVAKSSQKEFQDNNSNILNNTPGALTMFSNNNINPFLKSTGDSDSEDENEESDNENHTSDEEMATNNGNNIQTQSDSKTKSDNKSATKSDNKSNSLPRKRGVNDMNNTNSNNNNNNNNNNTNTNSNTATSNNVSALAMASSVMTPSKKAKTFNMEESISNIEKVLQSHSGVLTSLVSMQQQVQSMLVQISTTQANIWGSLLASRGAIPNLSNILQPPTQSSSDSHKNNQ